MIENETIKRIIEVSKLELKEVDVREEIITPLLSLFGYSIEENNLFREYPLKDPYIQVGSKRKLNTYYPDYLLKCKNSIQWIIETKSSKINLDDDKVVSQAFFYMNHPEIKASYFLLCNGKEIILYQAGNYSPILKFKILELQYYYSYLKDYLSNDTIELKNYKNKDYGMYLYSTHLNKVEHYYYDIPIDTFLPFPCSLTTLKKSILEDLHLLNDKAVCFDIRRVENDTIYYITFVLPLDILSNSEVGRELQIALYQHIFILKKTDLKLSDYFYNFSVSCIVSDIPIEGIHEIYYPMIITKVLNIESIQK